MKNQDIMIVVPIHKGNLTIEERMSIEILLEILGKLKIGVVTHKCVKIPFQVSEKFVFDSSFFSSRSSYSKLLLTRDFYATFSDFEYVLICQMDSLIFSREYLEHFDGDVDYIGAPFFCSQEDPKRGFVGAGNGGLSLRKVRAARNVLGSKKCPPFSYALAGRRWMPDLTTVVGPRRWSKALRVIREARRGVDWYTSHYTLNEDKFWSFRARLFDPSFRVAPVEKALEFSFECHPRFCYELNGRRLPFGCHAWAKHDREFWEQFIDVPKDA